VGSEGADFDLTDHNTPGAAQFYLLEVRAEQVRAVREWVGLVGGGGACSPLMAEVTQSNSVG